MGKSILADIAAGGDKSGISAMQADDGDFHDAEGRRWAREGRGGKGDVIMYTILFIFHPLGLLYSPVVLPDVPMNLFEIASLPPMRLNTIFYFSHSLFSHIPPSYYLTLATISEHVLSLPSPSFNFHVQQRYPL